MTDPIYSLNRSKLDKQHFKHNKTGIFYSSRVLVVNDYLVKNSLIYFH